MRLEADFNTWASNTSAIQEEFCSTLSNAFEFPKHTIRIDKNFSNDKLTWVIPAETADAVAHNCTYDSI